MLRLAAVMAVVFAVGGTVPSIAQVPTVTLCVTIAGVPPTGTWGAGTLAEAIIAGAATIEEVLPSGECPAAAGASLEGWYPTAVGSSYGFEFRPDGTVISRTGDDAGRAEYTVDGDQVLICIGSFCNELTLVGDCLFDNDSSGVYCKE